MRRAPTSASRRTASSRARAGVDNFDVSLEKQEVIVNTALPYDTVLERIKKTGKEVRARALQHRTALAYSRSNAGHLWRDRRIERPRPPARRCTSIWICCLHRTIDSCFHVYVACASDVACATRSVPIRLSLQPGPRSRTDFAPSTHPFGSPSAVPGPQMPCSAAGLKAMAQSLTNIDMPRPNAIESHCPT